MPQPAAGGAPRAPALAIYLGQGGEEATSHLRCSRICSCFTCRARRAASTSAVVTGSTARGFKPSMGDSAKSSGGRSTPGRGDVDRRGGGGGEGGRGGGSCGKGANGGDSEHCRCTTRPYRRPGAAAGRQSRHARAERRVEYPRGPRARRRPRTSRKCRCRASRRSRARGERPSRRARCCGRARPQARSLAAARPRRSQRTAISNRGTPPPRRPRPSPPH